MKRRFISGLLAGMMAVSLLAGLPEPVKVSAKTVSGLENANFNFEEGITGWETTGTVTEETSGAQGGSKYVHLEAGASITATIKDISQGSYTLSAWVRGTAGKNAKLTVSETGGPDAVALLDAYKNADTWTEMGHRNVLVYNGQMTITIEAGDKALDLDTMELVMDSADENTLSNWDFEEGESGWTISGSVETASGNDADAGDKALRLGADSEISQKISVEPNTRYSVTMRARVDKQDTFQTEKVKSTYRTDSAGNLGTIGENETRMELGDRVNLGVRSTDGTVLRQAPSGTEGYGLVTITFETGDDQTEVEVYANTRYDQAYKDSVTIYTSAGEKLADDWQGNGSDYAYVDNFDVFRIQDENYLRGADVSFLPAVEDLDGKYFANGVQQDCLRILSNHGVNSITNMLFVHAGKSAHYTDSLATVYLNEAWGGLWLDEQGNPLELKMIAPEDESEAWFDKEHSLELGKRATALGMSYLPSFHYSDTWMSNAKAYTPEEWLDTDYENTYKNTDLSHMQSIVYNYVYDFMKSLKDNNVNVCGVKHGNEQNGGIVWPVGKGVTSQGHAKLIAASYAAAEDAMPGVAAYVHTNNGYDSNQMKTFFKGLLKNGAEFDGMAFSLYGGRSSGNIISMANVIAADETLRYMDYVNVETAFSFTKYQATMDTATSSMGQPAYYNTSANGQYNWLLDYMQAALDTPNAYGQTRGFYYWEVDELPTPGIGSSAGVSGDISCRIMFNNGDTGIGEMGSTKDGKVGDMMDSMYAYLMRGCPKNKSKDMITPLKDAGTYSVEVTDPTGIKLSKDSITLAVGEQERLQPTVTPVDQVLSDSNITYTSSDSSVAKVTQDGFVYGVSAGDAKITASVKGGYEAAVDVKITEAGKAEGLTLKMDGKEVTDSSTHSAAVLDKVQLTSVLSGSNVTDQTVIYTSSDAEVASFLGETWQQEEKGSMRQETEKTDTAVQLNVKAVGSTVITAQTADGSKKVSFTLNVSKVDITSVTIDKTEVQIGFGRTLQLKASITPENTTKYKIHWKSENTSVATVDETGLVSTVGVGDAVIRAISDDNEDVYGSCTVHVLPVQVESIALSKTSLTLQTGSSKKIDTIITPSNADNKEVTWESSDDSIAKVDENGNVTGVAEGGPVTITATTKNGGYQASCKVTVQKDAIPVSSVTLDQENYYFTSDYFSDKNASENAPVIRMEATVLPDTATNTDVTWESDTPGVATVDAYGQVTAVAAGVTTITAKTADGGYVAAAKVYVPAVSESFDNREAGDTWDMGKSVTPGTLTAAVAEDSDGNAFLQMTGGGSGDRALMKKFQKAVRSDEVIVDFDWNVGKVSSGPAYLTVTDSSSHCYFGLQTNSKGVLSYGSRGTMEMGGELSDTQEFGTAFNRTNTWYHVHAVIDMADEKTTLTLTSKADESVTATKEIAFVSGTSYTKDVAAVHFYGRRNGGSLSWNPAVDNFNIYPAAVTPVEVKADKDSVKLIPVTGTRGVSAKVEASVAPASASQDLLWESTDTDLVTVTQDGTIEAVKTYEKLEDIVTGNCTVKVSSVKDPSIYKEIAVTVSNNPNASEFFSIKDENGDAVYEMGTGGQTVSLSTGDKKQFFPVLTGGDGESDYAGVTWTSDNSKVAVIDSESGKLTAKGAGTADITLKVTMYAGNPLTGTFTVKVKGEILADTALLESAISDAKTAKNQADDYYTAESLSAYYEALEQAESVLKKSEEEKWDSTKQSTLDETAESLNNAVAGLEKNTSITGIQISGGDDALNVNKQTTLTAEITPSTAEEKVVWTSDDLSVAVVDKNSGVVTAVGEGTATITAVSESRGVSAQKEITVTKDLTSAYDTNGIKVTETNSVRPAKNAFINARTMNLNPGNNAWTTGSATKTGAIAVDFGSDVSIENVKTGFWSKLKYTLDISEDGENWTTVIDHSEEAAGVDATAKEPYVDLFPENTVARHMRINVLANGGTGWIGITVLQVNGIYVSDAAVVKSISCEPVTVENVSGLTKETLPQTVSVTMADDTVTQETVEWEDASFNSVIKADEAGTYQVYGTAQINGVNYDVVCEVTVKDKTPVVVPTDKTALYEQIAKAEKVNAEDYTEESYKNLTGVLAAAKEVAANENAAQDEIDAAAENLNVAVSALVEKPKDTETPGNTEAPGNTEKPGNTETPGNTEKPGNTETPGNTEKPGNTETPGNTEKPDNTKKKVKVQKITITPGQYSLAVGKKLTLKATVGPKKATNKKVVWSSSNTKYATVNNKGVVTTKKGGAGKTVTITAKAADGSGVRAKVKIRIMKHTVTKITLQAKSKTVKAGKKITVYARVKTNGSKANKKIEWTSSNTKYATVNSKGVVTAKKAGIGKTVTITAKATDGSGKKAAIKIKIKK